MILDGLNSLVNSHSIELFLKDLHSYKAGNKSWPPLMMFKCLLLQDWYKLSDPAIERSLAKDLMFLRFAGLSLSESVPGVATLSRT
jgi:IS5 family transposase